MDEIYRFRTIDRLLGSSRPDDLGELQSQTIYFAESSKLNDPMEAVRDLVWRGDTITWMNLFRHYVNCLHHVYFLMHLGGLDDPVGPAVIPINMRWDDPPNQEYGYLVSEIWADVRQRLDLADIASRLVGLGRAVHSDELEFFLTFLHSQALLEIHQSYIERGLQDPETAIAEPQSTPIEQLPRLIELLEQLKEDGMYIEANFEMMQRYMVKRRIETKMATYSKIDRTSLQDFSLIYFDFPHEYVRQLSLAVGPAWYAACFAEKYGNSTMWGNYANGHSGVCLVFAVENDEHGPGLILHEDAEGDRHNEPTVVRSSMSRKFVFEKVHYVDSLEEVDFFARISRLPKSSVRAIWFTDDDGNMSSEGAHMAPGTNLGDWTNALWSEYWRDICTKMREWSFEREYRLANFDLSADVLREDALTLKYDFPALQGIIFGVNTSDEDMIAVIDLIKAKCKAATRTEFDFRQAYYSWHTGQIESYPLDVDVTR